MTKLLNMSNSGVRLSMLKTHCGGSAMKIYSLPQLKAEMSAANTYIHNGVKDGVSFIFDAESRPSYDAFEHIYRNIFPLVNNVNLDLRIYVQYIGETKIRVFIIQNNIDKLDDSTE